MWSTEIAVGCLIALSALIVRFPWFLKPIKSLRVSLIRLQKRRFKALNDRITSNREIHHDQMHFALSQMEALSKEVEKVCNRVKELEKHTRARTKQLVRLNHDVRDLKKIFKAKEDTSATKLYTQFGKDKRDTSNPPSSLDITA